MDSADRDSARKSEFPFTRFTRLILVARSRSLPSINIDFIETSSKRVQQRNDFKSHEKETRSINWKFQSFLLLEKLSNYQSLSLSFSSFLSKIPFSSISILNIVSIIFRLLIVPTNTDLSQRNINHTTVLFHRETFSAHVHFQIVWITLAKKERKEKKINKRSSTIQTTTSFDIPERTCGSHAHVPPGAPWLKSWKEGRDKPGKVSAIPPSSWGSCKVLANQTR